MPFRPAARRLLALSLPLLAAAAHAAPAAEVASGGQLVLATYYEVDGQECRPLSAPRVRIRQNGTLGKAIVVRTQGQSAATTRCPHKLVPVSLVLYQADKPGLDAVTWEVRYQRRGSYIERVTSEVRVGPPKR